MPLSYKLKLYNELCLLVSFSHDLVIFSCSWEDWYIPWNNGYHWLHLICCWELAFEEIEECLGNSHQECIFMLVAVKYLLYPELTTFTECKALCNLQIIIGEWYNLEIRLKNTTLRIWLSFTDFIHLNIK